MGQTQSIREEELKAQRETLKRVLHDEKPLNEGCITRFHKFVKKHPSALTWKDERGETLLTALFFHLCGALQRQEPLDYFRRLATIPQTTKVFRMRNGLGWTLLHTACRYNPTGLDIIKFLLEQYPDASEMLTHWKQTPLHIACIHKACLPVVKALVATWPRAVLACDFEGQTPLHNHVCTSCPSLDVIRFLAMTDLVVCLAPDEDGDLPLDVAKCCCRGTTNEAVVTFLHSITTEAARAVIDELEQNNDRATMDCIANGPSEEVAILKLMSLSQRDMSPVFRRDAVQSKIFARTRTL